MSVKYRIEVYKDGREITAKFDVRVTDMASTELLSSFHLSVEDQKRLNGYVQRVMQKNASELGELLRELGRMLPRSIERRQHEKVKEILA